MSEVSLMRVLELFSGIGGMQAALQGCGRPFVIVDSYEINPSAISIYNHNFSNKIRSKNIMGLTTNLLDSLKVDLLVMSPPCQPFTRQGLQRDLEDSRTSPFIHILNLLDTCEVKPKAILLENVAGFEESEAHSKLLKCMLHNGYKYQEYLLTPSQFKIPNSRLRYYLLAKLEDFKIGLELDEINKEIPICTCFSTVPSSICTICHKINPQISHCMKRRIMESFNFDKNEIPKLEKILDNFQSTEFLVQPKTLVKYGTIFDIVDKYTTGSCCFTKGYGTYVQGTGSVIHTNLDENLNDVFKSIEGLSKDDPKYCEILKMLKLRYFTPKEILRLMCFPSEFTLPQDCTNKQAYKCLGNSINVYVVSLLLSLLVTNEL